MTKLDRDPASGTALQEISFWLNLERALLRIQDIRESPDIALTLDILKHGKRFHATVSFDTDTGNFLCYVNIRLARTIVIQLVKYKFSWLFSQAISSVIIIIIIIIIIITIVITIVIIMMNYCLRIETSSCNCQ